MKYLRYGKSESFGYYYLLKKQFVSSKHFLVVRYRYYTVKI
jgi:hypothetical protein